MGIFKSTLIAMTIAVSFSCQCFGGGDDFGSFDSDVNSGTDIAEDISPARVSKPIYCDGVLNLNSPRRGEAYRFGFRDGFGVYNEPLITSLHWFLRCGDGTWLPIDVKVVELLNYLSKLLRDPVIDVLSAYRSPSYNRKLAETNENVARNSLHMYGKAIDFRVPGMGVEELCSYALLARNTLGYGGVGCYRTAGFIHIDSGPARQWAKN